MQLISGTCHTHIHGQHAHKMCIATCNVLRDCWLAFIYTIFCYQFSNFLFLPQQCANYLYIFSSCIWVFVKCFEFLRKLFEQTVTKWRRGCCWWWWLPERMPSLLWECRDWSLLNGGNALSVLVGFLKVIKSSHSGLKYVFCMYFCFTERESYWRRIDE